VERQVIHSRAHCPGWEIETLPEEIAREMRESFLNYIS